MISRSVTPIGTSTRPVLLTFPAKAKTFVPGAVFGPDLSEPVGTLVDDRGNIGEGLNIVD